MALFQHLTLNSSDIILYFPYIEDYYLQELSILQSMPT